ncbi:MAG: hypothetical protein KDD66_13040 [Bdellovibrionales bacterium]|nr:hypothetical protein [Bdellovibrionales bacterium]
MNALDWSIVAAYLIAVLAVGLSAKEKGSDERDYFLAGGRIAAWLAAVSVIATETSAATFIGGPDTAYRGDLAYLQTTIGAVASRIFLSVFFIGVFYEHRVVTVYGFLRHRFGHATQKLGASLFIVGRLLASGARLFIASLAVSTIADISIWSAIAAAGSVAVCYSAIGGLRSVILTDVLQAAVFFLTGCFTIWFLLDSTLISEQAALALAASDKLRIFVPNFNLLTAEFWANPYTLLGGIIGGFSLGMATHGTDQDMVQRLLACKDRTQGRRALILTAVMEIPVAIVFVLIGTGLWLLVQSGALSHPPANSSIMPHFIKEIVPSGLRGLLLAALLAAAMSSLDSAIAALASVSKTDFTRESHSAKTVKGARLHALCWGAALMLVAAVLAAYQGSFGAQSPSRESELLTLALGIMTIFYGPLLGIFLLGLFTERGSERTIAAGAAAGVACLLFIRYYSVPIGWTWHTVIGCAVTMFIAPIGARTASCR